MLKTVGGVELNSLPDSEVILSMLLDGLGARRWDPLRLSLPDAFTIAPG